MRFRPIMMTTVAMIAGMLRIALGKGRLPREEREQGGVQGELPVARPGERPA